MEAFPRPWPVHVNDANAELIALAPDHALLLRALTMDAVRWGREEGHPDVWLETEDGTDFRVLTLDAAGCPLLTPELREALRRAIGIEAANG